VIYIAYEVNDFFCGAGGMGLGFKDEGFNISGAWDIDKWAVQSYAHNVGEHVQLMDIKEMQGSHVPHAEIWTFGFPCQDVSIAGKKAGMIKGETRTGLFYEVMRLLGEVQSKPPIILAENVKGLKNSLPVVEEEYEKAGYNMVYTLYNSMYWDVPQNRKRYFIAGIRKDISEKFIFPKEQNEHIPLLSSILEENVDEKYYISDEKAIKIIEQALEKIYINGVHATLTPDRVERRQQWKRSRENEEPMFTLTSQDRHGVIISNLRDDIQSIFTTKDNCSYCIDANYHKGVSPGDVGKGRRTHIIEEIANETGLLHENGVGRTLRVGGKGSLTKKHNYEHILTKYFRVRRLTPRECARLQGFLDTYEIVVSDSQAYKQFGNAVTKTVSKGIAKELKRFLDTLNKNYVLY
jgi:DNA (cytosine-5)-methyltransferase 1